MKLMLSLLLLVAIVTACTPREEFTAEDLKATFLLQEEGCRMGCAAYTVALPANTSEEVLSAIYNNTLHCEELCHRYAEIGRANHAKN